MKEVIFVEGLNSSGKDYFLDNCQKYFPASSVYYAPKENYKRPYESCFSTYNTIFTSIQKDTSIYPSFVYRSPITEFVCIDFFRRRRDLTEEFYLIELLKKFMATFKCSFIYLQTPFKTLKDRGFEYTAVDFTFFEQLYDSYFNQFDISPVYEESITSLYNRLDGYTKDLKNSVLVDIDGTHYLPSGKIWNPSEVTTQYISGLQHDEFSNILYSPFKDVFISSFNFKYALMKKLCEKKKKFILYDNYLTLTAKAATDLNLKYSIIDTRENLIGRLDNSNLSIGES